MVNFYQSSIIKNTLNPTWEPFEMTVNEFNKGDFTKPLLFEGNVYKYFSILIFVKDIL